MTDTPKAPAPKPEPTPWEKFTDLARRVIAVPKAELPKTKLKKRKRHLD